MRGNSKSEIGPGATARPRGERPKESRDPDTETGCASISYSGQRLSGFCWRAASFRLDFVFPFSERVQTGQRAKRTDNQQPKHGIKRKITVGNGRFWTELFHPTAHQPVRKIGDQPADCQEQTEYAAAHGF